MKKVMLALVLALLVVPAALADNVDFSLLNITWGWAGGATPLTGSSPIAIATGQVGIFFGATFAGPAAFSTGNYTGGTGTVADPFTFGPAAPNTFSVAGCGGPCFLGTITSISLAHNASGNLSFAADIVIGNLNAALFGLMGIPVPANLNGWTGSLTGTLNGTANVDGGHGTNGSLDLVLQPVPEPGTLALFGSGLIGIAGVVRRKITSLR